jgi:hypothetical protein
MPSTFNWRFLVVVISLKQQNRKQNLNKMSHTLHSLRVFESRLLWHHQQAERRQWWWRAGVAVGGASAAVAWMAWMMMGNIGGGGNTSARDALPLLNNTTAIATPFTQDTLPPSSTWSVWSILLFLVVSLLFFTSSRRLWALARQTHAHLHQASTFIPECNRVLAQLSLALVESEDPARAGGGKYELLVPLDPVQQAFRQYKRDHPSAITDETW